MVQSLNHLRESPSQTAGPYVHIGCTPNFCGIGGVYPEDLGARMKTGPVQGEEIVVTGAVHDGLGMVMKDALIEIWQADAAGRFAGHDADADPNFTGFGRSPGDMDTGRFSFDTVKPGRVRWPDGRMQAPHVSVWIVARGINVGLQTRIYFADETDANAEDPILTRLEHQSRVQTLLAERQPNGDYLFNVYLQGPQETVFFDI